MAHPRRRGATGPLRAARLSRHFPKQFIRPHWDVLSDAILIQTSRTSLDPLAPQRLYPIQQLAFGKNLRAI